MEAKTGIKTTELWTTVATVCGLLGAVLPAAIAFVPPNSLAYAIIGIVLSVAVAVGAYAVQRGGVKKIELMSNAQMQMNAANIAAGAGPLPPAQPQPQPQPQV